MQAYVVTFGISHITCKQSLLVCRIGQAFARMSDKDGVTRVARRQGLSDILLSTRE